MKKQIFSSVLAAMVLCAIAQGAEFTEIRSGDAVMKVDGGNGAKIVSLTLDGQELLAQHKKPQGMPFENLNDFGSTFWPSPQSEWNWPPIATYDSAPYTVGASGDAVAFTSGKDEKYPYIITKTITPLGDNAYNIEYSITNASAAPVNVAPWEITRVPSGGRIWFEAETLRPIDEVAFDKADGIITIPFVDGGRKNRKVFADGRGWLAFENDGLRLVKRFADISPDQAAPGEEEIEIYYNFGTTYTEIENQGAYTTLAPGESITWPVVWEIQKAED